MTTTLERLKGVGGKPAQTGPMSCSLVTGLTKDGLPETSKINVDNATNPTEAAKSLRELGNERIGFSIKFKRDSLAVADKKDSFNLPVEDEAQAIANLFVPMVKSKGKKGSPPADGAGNSNSEVGVGDAMA